MSNNNYDNDESGALFAFGLAVGIVVVGLVVSSVVGSLLAGSVSGPLIGAAAALKMQGK